MLEKGVNARQMGLVDHSHLNVPGSNHLVWLRLKGEGFINMV